MRDTDLLFDDMYEPPNSDPFLVVLSYSAGRQSHRIARGVLRGEIKTPERFLVVAADPGNEHVDTQRIRDRTLAEFNAAGIHAMIAPGPKMLEELKEKKKNDANRIDHNAYWVEGGGRIRQTCTEHYKVAPMDRVVRAYLTYHLGVTRPDKCSVENWVGFCWDERHRIKKPRVAYKQFRYPLVDLRETKKDITDWYARTGEEMPPPSVCNHCWANGVNTYQRIHDTDPEGWNLAVEFDNASRDMSKFGIREKCFCSRTLLPLEELAANGFTSKGSDTTELACDSGVCFI